MSPKVEESMQVTAIMSGAFEGLQEMGFSDPAIANGVTIVLIIFAIRIREGDPLNDEQMRAFLHSIVDSSTRLIELNWPPKA